MKRLFTVMMMALAGSSAFAQWNTNATPKCLMGIEYTDPETGEVRKGGDYYICSPKVARTPDKKTWISWKTLGHKRFATSTAMPYAPTCSCSTATAIHSLRNPSW